MKGGLGDVFVDLVFDDVLRLETCLESSFWPWSLSPIRTPSYTSTRSLCSLSICFVCGLCVQDSQNSMRVLMGVSRTGYLKCWNRQFSPPHWLELHGRASDYSLTINGVAGLPDVVLKGFCFHFLQDRFRTMSCRWVFGWCGGGSSQFRQSFHHHALAKTIKC